MTAVKTASLEGCVILLITLGGCGSPSATMPGERPPSTSPHINSISPTSAAAGSPDLTLTVTGARFVNDDSANNHSIMGWTVGSGMTFLLITTFVSDTQVTAVVPAERLSAVGTARVSVNSVYDGEVPHDSSNSVDFTIHE